jgi:hypothetical protein
MQDFRRTMPRVAIEAMCWETIGHREVESLIVDLSAMGARLERPYVGGRTCHAVPLQIEVPGIDEVMWARGEVCFDQIVPCATAGPLNLLRRTGYRLAVAAARDRRLLEEFVVETHRARDACDLMFASCYARA